MTTSVKIQRVVERLRGEVSKEMNRYWISYGDNADRSFLKAEIYSELADVIEEAFR